MSYIPPAPSLGRDSRYPKRLAARGLTATPYSPSIINMRCTSRLMRSAVSLIPSIIFVIRRPKLLAWGALISAKRENLRKI